jgi:hypothetical protein
VTTLAANRIAVEHMLADSRADLFEKAIGWVIVARFKSAGQRVGISSWTRCFSSFVS